MITKLCYLCGHHDQELLVTFPDDLYLRRLSGLQDHSVTYVTCRRCGFVFQNPALESHELDEMYGEQYRKDVPDEGFITRNSVFTDGRARWISAHLDTPAQEGRRVLDVGCGAGMLLNSFKKLGWTPKGIEPTSAYAAFGSRRFGFDIIPGFFTGESFPGETFDLITLSQVLEHAIDPGLMLRDCRAKLAPEGRMFIGVPTLLRPQRPIHGNTLAGPHLSMFTVPTLRYLLGRERLAIVALDCDFKGLMVLAKPVATSVSMQVPKAIAGLTKQRFEDWQDEGSLYHGNFAVLKQRLPVLAKQVSRDVPVDAIEEVRPMDGYINVRFTDADGASRWLYTQDPVAHAKKAVDKYPIGPEGVVVLLGFGMGYLTQELLLRMDKGHVLIVCERSEALFRLAMERVDLRPLLKDPRVEFVVGDHPEQLDKLLATHSVKYMLTSRLVTLRQGSACRIDPVGYEKIQERVNDKLKVYQVNKRTRLGLEHLMLKNSLANVHQVMRMPGVNRLKNLFRGIPAIIVSAGPSLQNNLAVLKAAQGKAVIIACDTVLRLLVPNGITPDLTVTADPQETSYRKFRDIPIDRNSYLVCHPINYPDMISTFAGGRFAIGSSMGVFRWLSKYWEEKGQVDIGSQSVAHMAFNLACLIGAGPIIFIGQDFCFYDNKKYAGHLSKGSPWEKRMQRGLTKTVSGRDIFDQPVETENLFLSFKVLMEDLIKRSKVTCINATEGGLGLKGATLMTLHDAVEQYGLPDGIDVKGKIRAVCDETIQVNLPGMRHELAQTKKQAEELLRDSQKILKYVRTARQVTRRTPAGPEAYGALSERLEKRTAKFKEKEKFLNMLGEYTVALELYMTSQRVLEIDSVEDPAERFKKQVTRAGVYYRGLLRVLKPFVAGVKTVLERLDDIEALDSAPPKGVPELIHAMVRLKRIGCYDRAIAVGRRVLSEHPTHPEALLHLGEIAWIQHHPAEAQEYVNRMGTTGKRPARADLLFNRCLEKAEAWDDKVGEAIAQYQVPHPLQNANFYYRVGDYDRAIVRYQELIQKAPTWEAYYHLAHALIGKDDRDQAVTRLEQALALSPDNPMIYRDLGLLALDNGLDEIAERFWMEAVQLKPDDPRLYELLSDLYLKQGQMTKAGGVLEALAQLQPDRQDVIATLARIYQHVIANPDHGSWLASVTRDPAEVGGARSSCSPVHQ